MNPQNRPDGERLAILETRVEDVRAATANLSGDIKVLNASIERFFSQSIEKDTKNAIEMNNLQKAVSRLERKNSFWQWMTPTLAAASGSVLSILVINYLQHH